MLTLRDDNGKPLPKKVQKRVNDFIDNLKNVKWFEPSHDLTKEDVEKQVNFTLECFGLKAEVEYRKLDKPEDWASARASARASDWYSSWYSARSSAWESARYSAWYSAINSTFDSAWALLEILLLDNKQFLSKYPNGAFIQLFKLWEMGLYPVGILKNKKFVIYAKPTAKNLFK